MSPVVHDDDRPAGRLDRRSLVKRDGVLDDPGDVHWAGIACLKRAYAIFQERGYRARLLAAAYRHHLHWSELIGGDIVLTIPYAWQRLFNESDIEVVPGWTSRCRRRSSRSSTGSFPDFRRAYDPDGMTVEEFDSFGADGAHAAGVHRLLPGPGGHGPRLHAPEPGRRLGRHYRPAERSRPGERPSAARRCLGAGDSRVCRLALPALRRAPGLVRVGDGRR